MGHGWNAGSRSFQQPLLREVASTCAWGLSSNGYSTSPCNIGPYANFLHTTPVGTGAGAGEPAGSSGTTRPTSSLGQVRLAIGMGQAEAHELCSQAWPTHYEARRSQGEIILRDHSEGQPQQLRSVSQKEYNAWLAARKARIAEREQVLKSLKL